MKAVLIVMLYTVGIAAIFIALDGIRDCTKKLSNMGKK